MGELLDELKGPEEQCGPTDTLLHILSAVSTDDALFCFCSGRPEVSTDAQALYSQALCRLLTSAEELHHQILEWERFKEKDSEVLDVDKGLPGKVLLRL